MRCILLETSRLRLVAVLFVTECCAALSSTRSSDCLQQLGNTIMDYITTILNMEGKSPLTFLPGLLSDSIDGYVALLVEQCALMVMVLHFL